MIKYITYKSKKHPVRVSYYALKKTQQEVKKDNGDELSMEQIMSGDIELYEPLLFYALQAGYKAEEKENPIKRDDIEWVLDECFTEFINIVPSFFQGLEAGQKQPPKKPTNKTAPKKKKK